MVVNGVQQEHRREAHQLAMEQPMWMPKEEIAVKEDLLEIEDADASRELEPLPTMGRMSAPSSWSTRGGALQTQGAMPPDEVQPNGMGGAIPSYGVARQGAQTGGLGGEIPVQRSEGIIQEAGHESAMETDQRLKSRGKRLNTAEELAMEKDQRLQLTGRG